MSKKDNFSQAAYEMFGIGRGGSKREADKTAEKPAESAAMDVEEDEMSLTVAPTVAEVKPLEKVPEKPKTTLLAEGSVFEGTLHTKGDVEIAGVFKGDIFSEGNVKLFANIEGNVQGGNVELVTSSVQGDVSAKELLKTGLVMGFESSASRMSFNAREFIRQNPEIAQEIDGRIRAILEKHDQTEESEETPEV